MEYHVSDTAHKGKYLQLFARIDKNIVIKMCHPMCQLQPMGEPLAKNDRVEITEVVKFCRPVWKL